MLEKFLERLGAYQLGQRNPLLVQVPPFADSLMESGYAATTIQAKLTLIGDFGQWLRRRGLAVKDLDEPRIETFITGRRRNGLLRRGDRTTVRQLLDHLRERDVVQRVTLTRDVSPLAAILDRYEKHLRSERGLTTATIINYLPFARKFLSDRFGEGPFLLKVVRPCDISDFILRHARTMSCRRAQLMTTAFRSFFRFLFQRGELQVDLAPSIPTVADWRLSTLPRYITAEEVIRVLGSCDRHTATGRRDYALLLLLARLGLRAGEIVAMQLEDIDWRSGEILVRGKGLLYDRMAEAGAIVVTIDNHFLPVSMTLPLQAHSLQTERLAAQAGLKTVTRKRLWRQIVQAKIRAQGSLLKELQGSDGGLIATAARVRSGDPDNLEAQAARRYWGLVFGEPENGKPRFRRGADPLESGPDQNRHLDYGYTVLRASVARALCASGLHPSIGLRHHNRYDPFCLAADLMEPFRPLIDRRVVSWIVHNPPSDPLNAIAKKWLIEAVTMRYWVNREERALSDILFRVAGSLAAVLAGSLERLDLPETLEPCRDESISPPTGVCG
jgi:CRISPR-associated endonuclease Cas1 subtype II